MGMWVLQLEGFRAIEFSQKLEFSYGGPHKDTSKEGVLKDILKEFSYDGPDNRHLQNLSRLVVGFVLHVDGSSMCRRLPWCNQLGILADFIALEVWFFVQRKFGTCKVANLIIFKRWKWGLLIYSLLKEGVPSWYLSWLEHGCVI